METLHGRDCFSGNRIREVTFRHIPPRGVVDQRLGSATVHDNPSTRETYSMIGDQTPTRA